ncbi:MAG: DNA mismatch repair protein MutS [Proteobacteria bacterium]|nr:DNA mismatch repair protein MutS [Pseudomonadota bacterium]
MVETIKDKITPMMRQYLEVKSRYKDAFVFFRVGDFYELFYDDAINASAILGIALTSRDKSEKDAVPLCGVPYHSVDNYINKLLREGHKVVICDQIEDPKLAKGVVKREVTRVFTPGTVVDMDRLDPKESNYIFSLYFLNEKEVSVAMADISCGNVLYFLTDDIEKDVIEKMKPKEMVLLESQRGFLTDNFHKKNLLISFLNLSDDEIVKDETEKISLELIKKYIRNVILIRDFNFQNPKKISVKDYLYLDENAIRDLEIFEPVLKGEKNSSLLSVLDNTKTSMGGRKLRDFLTFPLTDRKEIARRLSIVEEFIKNPQIIEPLRGGLANILDIERIIGSLLNLSLSPKYLISLKNSLKELPKIKELIFQYDFFKEFFTLDELNELVRLIEDSVMSDPPFTLKEGNVIKSGYSKELDELRNVVEGNTNFLFEYEQKERERTGISSLKVGFNKIFGYYIEVTKSNLKNVPLNYIRKQTLVNAERFITDELKSYEDKVLSASSKIKELEESLYKEILVSIREFIPKLKELANELALLDIFSSFALNAIRYNYCRPVFNDGEYILIEDGRHPFVERKLKNFVSNDLKLSKDSYNIMVITGPNMAGKSTYMRQTALIAIMAQIGSYVPAKKAEIPVFDRIFTRIGSADFLASGKSTFMVEMVETANILRGLTEKSLIILDEVGRGTSTFDGMSIAEALLEYLSDKTEKPYVLFSTHYHELTELAKRRKNIKNFTIPAKEWKDDIIFLHKLTEGVANKSYGIYVAKLAGLPEKVIARAKEILAVLERSDIKGDRDNLFPLKKQPSLFEDNEKRIIKEIEGVNIEELTPLQAFDLLRRLKNML